MLSNLRKSKLGLSNTLSISLRNYWDQLHRALHTVVPTENTKKDPSLSLLNVKDSMELKNKNNSSNKILEDETAGVLGLTQDEHLVQAPRSS